MRSLFLICHVESLWEARRSPVMNGRYVAFLKRFSSFPLVIMLGAHQTFCCDSTPSRSLKPHSAALLVNTTPNSWFWLLPLRKWVCVGGFLALAGCSAGWLRTGRHWVGLQITSPGGIWGEVKGGIFRLLHWSVLSMSRSAAPAALRLLG